MNAYYLSYITKSFDESFKLNVNDLQIPSGKITVVVGANGSGKSTLLDLLAFLSTPDKGGMEFFENKVRFKYMENQRHHVGYVQQKPYLFNLTVYGNIEIGLRLRGINKARRKERVQKIADLFSLGHLIKRRAHSLSGGEAQKVALARTLVLEPEVLILDEPFTYLDKSFKQELENIIKTLKNEYKKTIIISFHDQHQAREIGDHVCSLMDGNLSTPSTIVPVI